MSLVFNNPRRYKGICSEDKEHSENQRDQSQYKRFERQMLSASLPSNHLWKDLSSDRMQAKHLE